ncbi:MAG: phosphatidylinositol-specific phospholipase C domain-containing protein [Prevotella sp.]
MKIISRSFTIIAVGCALFTQTANADNWITNMDDNVYVTKMSIPGTHDAATGEGFGGGLGAILGPSTAQTQELGIGAQWDCGIRAFDLRPTVRGTGEESYLQIYHGIIETKISFANALATLRDKLKENPGEFAIVIMRHENDADSKDGRAWAELMDECLNAEDISPWLMPFKASMKIGDIRGKILVLSRDTYNNGPVGGYITSWSHSSDFTEQRKARVTGTGGIGEFAMVQDFYDCTGTDGVDTKKATVINMLNESIKLKSRRWVINHTSGYTKNASSDGYRDNAAKINQAAIEWLDNKENIGSVGIIVMDYAGVDQSKTYDVKGLELTNAVIAQNTKTSDTNGITNATANNSITIDGRTITSQGHINVYMPDGRKISSDNAQTSISTKGLYIVRAGNETKKIYVK